MLIDEIELRGVIKKLNPVADNYQPWEFIIIQNFELNIDN